MSDASIIISRFPAKNQASEVLGDVVLGDSPKGKVLCLCGAIADVDSGVASTKKRLGKSVECRSCRNERIAQEMEDLKSHFAGDDENGSHR